MNTQPATLTLGNIAITAPPEMFLRGLIDNILPASKQIISRDNDVPAIGSAWAEHGGVLAGIMRGENENNDYYLIVPTCHAARTKLTWGGYGTETDNANHEFDGFANTQALADGNHPAADWANNLIIDGRNDFYLPSRRELALCFANVPELFETAWHWSSTQFSADGACIQDFGDGDQSYSRKVYEYRVRAVRRLLIIK